MPLAVAGSSAALSRARRRCFIESAMPPACRNYSPFEQGPQFFLGSDALGVDLCDITSRMRLGFGSPPGAGAAVTSPSPARGGKKALIWGWRCRGQMQGVWLSWAKLFSPMESFCFLLCFPPPVAQLSLLWMDLLAWQPGFIAGSPAHPSGHFGCGNKWASSPLFPNMLQTKQEASACPCSRFWVFFARFCCRHCPFVGAR